MRGVWKFPVTAVFSDIVASVAHSFWKWKYEWGWREIQSFDPSALHSSFGRTGWAEYKAESHIPERLCVSAGRNQVTKVVLYLYYTPVKGLMFHWDNLICLKNVVWFAFLFLVLSSTRYKQWIDDISHLLWKCRQCQLVLFVAGECLVASLWQSSVNYGLCCVFMHVALNVFIFFPVMMDSSCMIKHD